MTEATDRAMTEPLYRAESEIDADAFRSLLSQEGIASTLTAFGIGAYPGVADRGHWGEVRVAKQDLPRAQQLLAEFRAADEAGSAKSGRSGAEVRRPVLARLRSIGVGVLLLASLGYNVLLVRENHALTRTFDSEGRLISRWEREGVVRFFDVKGHATDEFVDADNNGRFEIARTLHQGNVVLEAVDGDGDALYEAWWAMRGNARIAQFVDADGDGFSESSVRLREPDADPEASFPKTFDRDADGLPDEIVCEHDAERVRSFLVQDCALGEPRAKGAVSRRP